MDQNVFVAQLNIEHFRQKLAGETDPMQRQLLCRLLEDQEAKLAVACMTLQRPNHSARPPFRRAAAPAHSRA
jgi:hypothetical protein